MVASPAIRDLLLKWALRLGPFALLLLVAAARPGWFAGVERALVRVSRRRALVIGACALIAFCVTAGLAALVYWPRPAVHDEFSYLLAADTFAHGRLSNPTHPLWQHFETMHVIQRPTYASKYPPGQGAALAVGQVLTGAPLVGVWLLAAFAAGALCWMMYAWLPAPWAAVGGLLSAIHPMITVSWGQNYWGGCLALGAGALFLGGARYLLDRPTPARGALMAAGFVGLMFTRPAEGLVFALLTLALVPDWRRALRDPAVRRGCARGPRAAAAGLAVAGGLWLVYNYRVTGAPLLLPYAVYEKTYAVAPLMVWQHPRPEPVYRHRAIQMFQAGWTMSKYEIERTPRGFLTEKRHDLANFVLMFLVSPALLMAAAGLPRALRRRGVRAVLGVGVLSVLAVMGETWLLPHYLAPAAAALLLLVMMGLRGLRRWRWRGRAAGAALVRAAVAAAVAQSAIAVVAYARAPVKPDQMWAVRRAQIATELTRAPGRHLVIVHYRPDHNPHDEWVYNGADIDGSKVVWAREMSPEADGKLLSYFHDRRVWLLDADAVPPRLTAYPADRALVAHAAAPRPPQPK